MHKLKKFKRVFVVFMLFSMFFTTFGEQFMTVAHAEPDNMASESKSPSGTKMATASGSDSSSSDSSSKSDKKKKDKSSSKSDSKDATKNSNSRRQELMDFAKGMKSSDIQGVEDLTVDDIRILGVFISNFYVPWQTKINAVDDETVNNIVDTLVKSCSFDKDVARSIVNACWKVSMSPTPVKLAKYDLGTKKPTDVGSVGRTPDKCVNYDELLYYMSGAYTTSGTPDGNDYCLYWDNNGTPNVVMESYNNHSNWGGSGRISESAISYAIATGGVDYAHGIGSSVTTKTSRADADTVTADTAKKDTATTWGIYIDAFGNLLVDTDGGQYVLVPACLNAYTWTTGDKNEAGQAVPLVNLLDIANTCGKSGSGNSSKIRIYGKDVDDKIQYDFGLSGGLFQTDQHWTLYRDFQDSDSKDAINFNQGWFSPDTHVIDILSHGSYKDIPNLSLWTCPSQKETFKANNEASASKKSEKANGSNKTDLYFPSWFDLFDSIDNAGGTKQVNFISDLVWIDSLDAFKKDNGDGSEIKLTENGIFSKDTYDDSSLGKCYEPLSDKATEFGTTDYYTIKNGSFNIAGTSQGSKYMVGIYVSYILAYEGDSKVHYKFNKDGLPQITDKSFVFTKTSVADSTDQLKQIQNMVYYLLSPSEGIRYIKQWFKTKMTSILVGIHEDIVGSGNKNNVGVTKYLGFSGYVTTPELTDLSWTSSVVDKYTSFFIYLVIFIAVILTGYVMIGSMTVQKALCGVAIFAVCAYYPPTLIDATINFSNTVSSNIYGEKFMYWALIQSQTYVTDINKSATSGNYDDYMKTLTNDTADWNDDKSGNSIAIALKWMCPKKNNYMYKIQKELEDDTGSTGLSHLLLPMLSKEIGGETFISSENANYLFRSYSDISNYSRYLYQNLSSYKTQSTATDTDKYAGTSLNQIEQGNKNAFAKGFSVVDSSDKTSDLRWKALYSSSTLANAMSEDVSDAKLSYTYGLKQSVIDYDLSTVNKASSSLPYGGLYTFEQYTESPFYFFSWNYFDQGISSDDSASGSFKSLMLGEKTGGKDSYFYNTKISGSGQGQVRDYLDMRNLFTAVIPVLHNANKVPVDWDNKYSLKTYKGVSCDPDAKCDDKDNETDWNFKHWHNVNVAQIWNMYCPWVDTMYDCKYAKSENITVAGKKFLVKDPLNPSSYPGEDKGRPMVFSKSEMEYWGLKTSDLTTVEIKIQKVQEDTMKDLYRLMNYYNFNDTVLDSAASMVATFNFNKEFSETNFLSESFVMFPQSFELKNFSYDAYLRLIMANATGESLQSKDDLYQVVVQNSSILTGVFLIINDALANYFVAGLKLFFLLGIFFMSIVMIVSATIQIRLNLVKTLWESLIFPLLKFLAVSVAHAVVVSWFMTEGNTAVTGATSKSISMGDPAMTLGMMIIVNCVVILLYFRIVRFVIKNGIKYAKAVTTSIGGMAGGVLAGISGVALSSKVATGYGSDIRGSKDGNVAERNNRVKVANKSVAPKNAKTAEATTGKVAKSDIDEKCAKGREKLNNNSSVPMGDTNSNKSHGIKILGVSKKSESENLSDGNTKIKAHKSSTGLFGVVNHSKETMKTSEKVGKKYKTMSKDKVNSNTKIKAGRLFSYNLSRNYATGKEEMTRKSIFGTKTVTRDIGSGKVSGVAYKGGKKVKSTVGNGAKKVKGVAKGLGAKVRR